MVSLSLKGCDILLRVYSCFPLPLYIFPFKLPGHFKLPVCLVVIAPNYFSASSVPKSISFTSNFPLWNNLEADKSSLHCPL